MTSPAIQMSLLGDTEAKLWGLKLPEWQARAAKKAGAEIVPGGGNVHLLVNWVLSAALSSAFIQSDKTALRVDGQIIGLSGVDPHAAQEIISGGEVAARAAGLTVASPEDIAGSYNKALRKYEPPYALNIDTTPVREIMQRQFDSSYKGITDFVTKWAWPVPAFYVTRACAAMRLTPNMITTVGLVLTLAAMYYFWQGQWFLGFLTGWLMTFLDTVDGKLARTTMTYSAWGNIYDHGIDLIHPPFWYWAWFIGLGFTWNMGELATLALLAIFVGYVVDRIIEGIFIAQHGFHIHVWRPINSGLRFFTARRNPNMVIFMVGILLSAFIPQAGVMGFYAVAAWTWACILFNIGVVIVGIFARKPLTSWMESAE